MRALLIVTTDFKEWAKGCTCKMNESINSNSAYQTDIITSL